MKQMVVATEEYWTISRSVSVNKTTKTNVIDAYFNYATIVKK